jgi:hypothetical protein
MQFVLGRATNLAGRRSRDRSAAHDATASRGGRRV